MVVTDIFGAIWQNNSRATRTPARSVVSPTTRKIHHIRTAYSTPRTWCIISALAKARFPRPLSPDMMASPVFLSRSPIFADRLETALLVVFCQTFYSLKKKIYIYENIRDVQRNHGGEQAGSCGAPAFSTNDIPCILDVLYTPYTGVVANTDESL